MSSDMYEIAMTRPCTDAPGKYIAESSFGRKFAMSRLCDILKEIEGVKCSESLGVAKFDYNGRTLILYRSGRVDLRKIADKQDAGETMSELEAMLEDAFERQ